MLCAMVCHVRSFAGKTKSSDFHCRNTGAILNAAVLVKQAQLKRPYQVGSM